MTWDSGKDDSKDGILQKNYLKLWVFQRVFMCLINDISDLIVESKHASLQISK